MINSAEDYYDNLDELFNLRVNEIRLPVLVNAALTIFTSIPGVNEASLFFMNHETYEFYPYAGKPVFNAQSSEEMLKMLIESHTVGECIQNNKMSFMPDYTHLETPEYNIVLPMLTPKGVLGVTVLHTMFHPANLKRLQYRQINALLHLFTTMVDSLIMHESQEQMQQTIDQLVASRTIRLVESKKELGEKFESLKTNLSRSVPHEVRTPINQIRGLSDYLIKSIGAVSFEELKEILVDIHSSADRLNRLFENYLFYANLSLISANVQEIQIIRGKITVSAEATILQQAQQIAANYDRVDDLEFNFLDTAIQIPEEFIMKVTQEIVDNCCKYSEKGQRITITSFSGKDDYIIEFANYGRGMTEEQISRIDAYMQFERMVYEQQGSGLGLAIVSKIMAIIGGSFSISSHANQSTTAKIIIPLATDFDIENL